MNYLLDNKKYKLPKKILIANRGEIAIRIIRACHELHIETVALYSKADENSLHIQLADEKILIGPGQMLKSYMHMPSIIEAAIKSGADAIHPGYGMFSENFEFAKLISESGLIWIGPNWKTIKALGDKITARKYAKKAKVPILEGSPNLKNVKDAKKWAKQIGYPVIVKAANGGGGRAMMVANNRKEIQKAFESVMDASKTLYSSKNVYLEKYVPKARHIEIQILADSHGNVRHLYDRDCTLQRKNQKIIEEAPSPFISDETRNKMTSAAIALAKSCKYVSAGTFEFIVDQNQNFYFMEANTRIQVEHPVTEEITGLDIVKEQIKIAGGNKFDFKQDQIKINGHSIEVRINAENPKENFLPQSGFVDFVHHPSGKGIRVESLLYSGYQIPPFYDSMITKVITKSKTREGAILKMQSALQELVVSGTKTNISFLLYLLLSDDFVANKHTTRFVEEKFMKKYLKFEEG